MFTQLFYQSISQALKSAPWSEFYIAAGSGDAAWDRITPPYQRDVSTLTNELARNPVLPGDVQHLDQADEVTEEVSPRLRITTIFENEQAVGVIRECGLFGINASGERDSGTLLSYFIHPRIDKTDRMQLQRFFIWDLQPGRLRFEGHQSRYLGNAISTELHDLDNETGACQISELRIDRRHYFDSEEQAVAMGYDFCGFCFGRARSER